MRRLLAIALVIVSAGCTDIASPTLNSVYQYGMAVGTDTLYFHWPRSRLPVRIWVADTSVLKPHMVNAIQRWQAAFLFGEYRAVLVSDSTMADVIVISLASGGEFTTPGGILNRRAAECSGVTETPNPQSHVWSLPIHTYIAPNVVDNNPKLDLCYDVTATHELGHTMGLLAHSPVTTDMMYSDPHIDSLSENDRETAVTAYHVPANVTLSGNP